MKTPEAKFETWFNKNKNGEKFIINYEVFCAKSRKLGIKDHEFLSFIEWMEDYYYGDILPLVKVNTRSLTV